MIRIVNLELLGSSQRRLAGRVHWYLPDLDNVALEPSPEEPTCCVILRQYSVGGAEIRPGGLGASLPSQ